MFTFMLHILGINSVSDGHQTLGPCGLNYTKNMLLLRSEPLLLYIPSARAFRCVPSITIRHRNRSRTRAYKCKARGGATMGFMGRDLPEICNRLDLTSSSSPNIFQIKIFFQIYIKPQNKSLLRHWVLDREHKTYLSAVSWLSVDAQTCQCNTQSANDHVL